MILDQVCFWFVGVYCSVRSGVAEDTDQVWNFGLADV